MSYEVGNKKPPKHSRFKPGQSGNPLGGKLHNPLKREIQKLTGEELSKMAKHIVAADLAELKRIRKDPNSTALQAWVASIAINGIRKGDVFAMDKLLERMIGKVPQPVRVGDTDGNPLPAAEVHVHIPANGRERKDDEDSR